jgi:hypothetical protein
MIGALLTSRRTRRSLSTIARPFVPIDERTVEQSLRITFLKKMLYRKAFAKVRGADRHRFSFDVIGLSHSTEAEPLFGVLIF